MKFVRRGPKAYICALMPGTRYAEYWVEGMLVENKREPRWRATLCISPQSKTAPSISKQIGIYNTKADAINACRDNVYKMLVIALACLSESGVQT